MTHDELKAAISAGEVTICHGMDLNNLQVEVTAKRAEMGGIEWTGLQSGPNLLVRPQSDTAESKFMDEHRA